MGSARSGGKQRGGASPPAIVAIHEVGGCARLCRGGALLAMAARRVLGGYDMEDLVRLEGIVLRWREEKKKPTKRELIGNFQSYY